MNQNQLKESFPVILKDEETGQRTMLTEDGQERLDEGDEVEMNDSPNFELPDDVSGNDSDQTQSHDPVEMKETVENVMSDLFSDDTSTEETVREREAVDPMERWIAPTIEEDQEVTSATSPTASLDSGDSLQLSESDIRKVIQQEIRRVFG